MIYCYLKFKNMQNVCEKAKQIKDICCVVEKGTGSKIVYRHCGCDKCGKRDSNHCDFNEIHIQNDKQHLVSELIKPCSVFIRRLDLLGHDGNRFSNCCFTFPEISISKNSITNKNVGKIEHGNSMTENGIENLTERNRNSVRKQMDLLFESLCETFDLLRAKKEKYKKIQKVDFDVFSCNSGKLGIKASNKLTCNLHQDKNQINKTSKISKPYVSRNDKSSCLPTFKSVGKNIGKKENFKNANENRLSYGETKCEIENQAPSFIDNKSLQIRYLSSSKVYTSCIARTSKIAKVDSGLFVGQRKNYNDPLTSSTTKIFPRFPAKSNQDNAAQTHDLLFSLNNSKPYCASKHKTKDFENALDDNKEMEIRIANECIAKKNVERKAKKYSIDKDVELISENLVYLSNHKIKSKGKVDNTAIKNKSEIKIVGEYIFTRNIKEATIECSNDTSKVLINGNQKYLKDDERASAGNRQILNKVIKPCSVFIELMDEKMINSYCSSAQTVVRDETNNGIPQIEAAGHVKDVTMEFSDDTSKLLNKGNSHENEKYLKGERGTVGNRQIMNKAMKPCSVFIELVDEKMINPYCNITRTVARDETNIYIPQMETAGHCDTHSCLSSSDLFMSSTIIDKNSNKSFGEKFTVRNEQSFKYHKRIPLIKPCSVVVEKLPFDKYWKFMNPTVINSVCNKNASCYVKDETESYILEEKDTRQYKINLCPSDFTISSALYHKIPNVNDFSKLAVINEQAKENSRKTSLVKPCVQNFSVKELVRKSSLKMKYNFLKFKTKSFMAFNRRKTSLLYKKNMSMKCIVNRMQEKKFNNPFICKKLKKKPKVLKKTAKECEKDVHVKEQLIINNCINGDKISCPVLRENQYICISPKYLSSNFRTNNCCVLLKKVNAEDLNVNNCRNAKVSSMRLIENTSFNKPLFNTSSGILGTCPSSNLGINNCFVLLERINVDEYLKNRNLINNKYDLKFSSSSDVLCKCSASDFRIRDCFVLLKRINLDNYLAKNKNIFDHHDLRFQSENLTVSKHGNRNKYNRYKIDKNSAPNARLKLKRKSPFKAEGGSKLNVKKLKKITDYFTLDKTVKSFKNSNSHSNLICDSNYKCVQCRQSITSDVELYHHLCCGKRKKGYICDICEKIFETIPKHKKHLNYHYKFIC